MLSIEGICFVWPFSYIHLQWFLHLYNDINMTFRFSWHVVEIPATLFLSSIEWAQTISFGWVETLSWTVISPTISYISLANAVANYAMCFNKNFNVEKSVKTQNENHNKKREKTVWMMVVIWKMAVFHAFCSISSIHKNYAQ